MVDEDAILSKMAANEELHAQGKLSYNAMCLLNEQLMAQMQAACSHSKTEKDDLGHGDYILWCANDNCGIMVEKHVKDKKKAESSGAVGKTKKKKKSSGCVVLVAAVVGVASAVLWAANEAIQAIL